MKFVSSIAFVIVAGLMVGCEYRMDNHGHRTVTILSSVNGLDLVIQNESSTPQRIFASVGAGGCDFIEQEDLLAGRIIIPPNEDYVLHVRPYGQVYSFELKAKAFDPKLGGVYGRYTRRTFRISYSDRAVTHWQLRDQNPRGMRPPSMGP